MRKILSIIGVGALMMCMVACGSTSTLEQARAKQGKAVLDNLKKEGWEMNDISRSMEVAVLEHHEKLKNPENQPISATVICKIMSNCDLVARTEATRKYAQQAGSFLRERITGDNHLDQTNLDSEFAKLYSGYEILVQKEISSEVVPSFEVVRKAQNGAKEYKAFFIINEGKASAARLRALERAFKETEAAQKYANQIADFVREGFKITGE
ncbi:MAG: hypothetical protein LBG77_09020, partial [Dysgonamonadaceae bacterium]|nr:hypothetical protein [Dysgonamonadaceae bacterium]